MRFLLLVIILILVHNLVACTPVQPPSDEAIKIVDESCKRQGKIVYVFYDASMSKLECV